MEQLDTLKKQVEYVLKNFPEARNSDKRLTIELWSVFYTQFIHHLNLGLRNAAVIPLECIMDLPSQDSIKRIRAYIQNYEKKHIPTDIDVAKERGWLESDWKKALGYFV